METCNSGIYQIKNTINGKVYIGSTFNYIKRIREHKWLLSKNIHHSVKLQRAWNKHGKEAFEFSIIEYVVNQEDLVIREQHWIDILNSFSIGYNTRPVAENNKGFLHTEETRAKMSATQKEREYGPKSESHRESLRKAILAQNAERRERGEPHYLAGRPKTESHKLNMRKPKKEGTPEVYREVQLRLAAERKAKGLPSPIKGKPKSAEAVANSVAAKKANKKAREDTFVVMMATKLYWDQKLAGMQAQHV